MTLAFVGSFSAGYSRNSKMKCGVTPCWANAGTCTRSSTEYGIRCVHSAPGATLVFKVASDLPPGFRTSRNTPPGAASAPRSLTVHSAGWSNSSFPSGVLRVCQSAAVGAGVPGADGGSVGGTSTAPLLAGADVSGGTVGIDGDVGPGP